MTLLDSDRDEDEEDEDIKIQTSTSRYTRTVENLFLSQKKDTLRHMLHSNCISGQSSGASSDQPKEASSIVNKDGSEGHKKIESRSSSKLRFQSMWKKYQQEEDYESDSSVHRDREEGTTSDDRFFSHGNGKKRTKLLTIQNDEDGDDDNSIR